MHPVSSPRTVTLCQPEPVPPYDGRVKGKSWCKKIIRKLNDYWDSHPLFDFLAEQDASFIRRRGDVQRKIVLAALRLPDPSSLAPTSADKNPAMVVHQLAEEAVDPRHEQPFDSIFSSEIQAARLKRDLEGI
ncbi:MAG: hypothetical protein M1816_003867 [Peltula sp. TS41687]|nr:MAG: hypothetical protein M1816_003867 [Peltula sp. TS41687]